MLKRIFPILAVFLTALSASAQDFEFRNTIYGIDIHFLDRFSIDFDGSNVFPISIDGNEYQAEVANSLEKECIVPASSYHFDFKDGESYRFIFSYRHRSRGLVHVDEKVTYRKPKLFTISIGVNEEYQNFKELKNAQKSAATLNNISKIPSFFPLYGKGQSYLISSGSELPNKKNLENRLTSLQADMRDGDLLLFYFAGHGVVDEKDNFSFVLENGYRYSGNNLASYLRAFKEGTDKIVIVCSCYSRQLWTSICDIPNTTFVFAGKSLIQGDIFAENLMVLLNRTKEEEMSFNDFSNRLIDSHPGSGLLPISGRQDFTVSLAPEESSHAGTSKGPSNLIPTVLSVVPGAGQFYKKEYVKGICFTGGTLLMGSGIIVFESMRTKYLRQASQTYDVSVRNSLQTKAGHMRTASTVCMVGTGIAYLWSILDAAISPNRSAKSLKITTQGITYKF